MQQTAAETVPAVAFKGRMMALTVLEIRHTDLGAVAADLDRHMARAADFFCGMPVLLSLPAGNVDLPGLTELLRTRELAPVAVLDGDAVAARAAGLGAVRSARIAKERGLPRTTAVREPAQVVDRPVRSGQQVYARNADLVVAAAVGEGAEVLADGHIHIYGALRGRALAGASGDETARIFCRRFEADLVAVAGRYRVADDVDERLRGKPVQVRLDGDNLVIEGM